MVPILRTIHGAAPVASLLAVVLAALVLTSTAESTASLYDDIINVDAVPGVATMDLNDVIGIVIMAIALVIAAAGGIGGAVVMIPTMVLLMGFDVKVATPIANLGIFGGGIANAVFNIRKRNPKVDRPLIEPDLVMIMIPAVIGGVIVGTVLTNLLPSYLLSLLIVVMLAVSNSRMLVKSIVMFKKESLAMKAKVADIEAPASPLIDYMDGADLTPSMRVAPTITLRSDAVWIRAAADRGDPSIDPELVKIIDQERRFDKKKHSAAFACYLLILAVSIADSLVTCGGVTYWVLLGAEIPCIVVFEIFAARLLLAEYETKKALNYPFAEGDVRWTKKTVCLFAPACVVAGIVAGTFGIGAAMITSPILIEMGVMPEVLSANSALMVLYSSAAATTKYAVFNMIQWQWAALIFSLSLVVTALSQHFVLGYVRRSGRQSIILLCIVFLVTVGGVLMLYEGVKLVVDDGFAPFAIDVCD